MTCIFISVGQCGNQLANTFIDYLQANKIAQTSNLFDHFDGKFRFVNLDSEAKVINKLIRDHGDCLRNENIINTKCGRGSNWASGYSGLNKDGALKIIELSLEAIRRESERCDFLLNFNIFHSLSGGTGSGCGSKLIEQLRDEYGSKKFIFTQSVAPFRDGEMPLQHYNNLLCLSHLHEFVDCITLYQNDDILNLLEKSSTENRPLSNTKNSLNPFNKMKKPLSNEAQSTTNSISFNDMNSYIVKNLLTTIYPVDNVSLKSQSIGMEYLELQRLLCSNPNLKIIEIYNVNNSCLDHSTNNSVYSARSSQSNNNLITKSNPLLKSILTLIPKYKKNNTEQFVSLGSLIISRSNMNTNLDSTTTSNYLLSQLWQDIDLIKKNLNPVEWNPFTIDFWSSNNIIREPAATSASNSSSSSASTTSHGTSSSLTFVLNRNKCVEYLNEVSKNAAKKYLSKAYLHWYHKFNITNEHFVNAFENIQTIIDSYEQMTC